MLFSSQQLDNCGLKSAVSKPSPRQYPNHGLRPRNAPHASIGFVNCIDMSLNGEHHCFTRIVGAYEKKSV